jgi:hypothetical protein
MDPDFPAETSWLSVERSRGAVVPDPKQKAKAFTLPRLAWKIIQPCLKPPSSLNHHASFLDLATFRKITNRMFFRVLPGSKFFDRHNLGEVRFLVKSMFSKPQIVCTKR